MRGFFYFLILYDYNDKLIKFKFKKVIAVAAVVAVLLVGTLSASASIFDINLFDGMVELYNDHIRINFDKTDNKAGEYQLLGTELAKELADNGFGEVLLPEAFFSEEYEITKIDYEIVEYISSADIIFKCKNKSGCIDITKYTMEELIGNDDFPHVTSDIEELTVGNVTVYCFMQGDSAGIAYRDGLSIYFIQIPLELDEAIEFAKTIK